MKKIVLFAAVLALFPIVAAAADPAPASGRKACEE
jgi:hypothetical protein